jgi:hypothetical protein
MKEFAHIKPRSTLWTAQHPYYGSQKTPQVDQQAKQRENGQHENTARGKQEQIEHATGKADNARRIQGPPPGRRIEQRPTRSFTTGPHTMDKGCDHGNQEAVQKPNDGKGAQHRLLPGIPHIAQYHQYFQCEKPDECTEHEVAYQDAS